MRARTGMPYSQRWRNWSRIADVCRDGRRSVERAAIKCFNLLNPNFYVTWYWTRTGT
ncbi:uncharacterized protein LACBIDRAFT_300069 [Laccaria bicolor S238N-H82]|uniref:Predicted protein n=1 Tax=Laccaria bicolor (strain S238N-H82 / ATCC MYA-4686) TaxID=486041 RepID=B0DFY9_LACBS|nr:uncharacterized protein LACBIDRAFT_300069 [Laccaria bicolor S238N-H82]EDR06427.1 predicted protein [Laccaria bicolor S238N-H82]|eukprot:XP_001882799.1 predicted protein [Laccaria bicolor S238N-H82]